MKQTTKNIRLYYILLLYGLLLLSGCGISNRQEQDGSGIDSVIMEQDSGGADSTVMEQDEGEEKEDVNEICTEDSANDTVSMQYTEEVEIDPANMQQPEKRIYTDADEVQGNILGYSLRRMPPNPENMYYEQDMPHLVEEELVGKGIYISDYMCEMEVFLGNILKEVLAKRGSVSGENRKYFTDYALRQLEGTDWGLLDAAWEFEPFAYDREYSVNPLSGGAGYYFRYSFYPDQDRTVKEKTNKTDFTLYVDNEGRICEIKTSISTIPAAESGMEEWINTDGLADNTYCEQIIRDGRPCNEKMVWDFERHFRRFMTPEEVYEQENTGLLESGNVCASAENLAGIFSHIMQNRGADAERYKEYFSYDESYEEFADTEWRLLGEAWTAEKEYDCFFVDSIYSSGYAGFRYYFYPDYESMDVSEAKAVVIDCNINIYNGMIDYSNIDIFPFTIEEYQTMKQNRDKNRQLVIDQGNVLSNKVKVAIPLMDRQIDHIPVSEFDPNAVERSSGRRKVKEELWGFTDTAEAANDLGKKFLKDFEEDNLQAGEICRFVNDKEDIYSALYAIDSFRESGWKADMRYDCFWVRSNEAAGCMHLQYYFYPERTSEEPVSGRTLVVDVFVSEKGIENMEVNNFAWNYLDHESFLALKQVYEQIDFQGTVCQGDQSKISLYKEKAAIPEEPDDIGDCKRVYDFWTEFEDEGQLPYASEVTFEFIKAAYDEIDFIGEFKEGNLLLYDDYKEKYRRLVQNEVPFYDVESGTEVYINNYIHNFVEDNVEDCKYYFFDVDEDNAPELCIAGQSHIYVIDYDYEADKYATWYLPMVGWYSVIGSRKVMWWWGGKLCAFYQLDRQGNEECRTFSFKMYKGLINRVW